MIEIICRSAQMSDCGRYRYALTRTLNSGAEQVAFVLLNPSTADGMKDDQTVRRCIGFAHHWGYKRLLIVNLFPFRATRPSDMLREIDPTGFNADDWIFDAAFDSAQTICAWGAQGRHRGRGAAVKALLQDAGHTLYHLGLTAEGQPRHPLYLNHDTPREIWT